MTPGALVVLADMASKKTKEKGAPSGASEAVKEEMFQWMAAFKGFDIRGFDKWHSELGDCGARRELSERRELAKEAATKNNTDALLRHLEWMLLRWKYIQREDYILPLARTGDKVNKPFQVANKRRSAASSAQKEAWQNRADEKWAHPQHCRKTASEIARLIAEPGENPGTIRRAIRKKLS